MTATLPDIYAALRDSVRYYPKQEQRCQQPQTWRVLQSLADASAPNFGATVCDKDKPFFWSRLWHEKSYNPNAIGFNFPVLYAFELDGSVQSPFDNAKYIRVLQIGVIDALSDSADARKCVGCDSRTINEIQQDTELILVNCLDYLNNTRPYRIDGNVTPVWANADFVSQGTAAQRFIADQAGAPILVPSFAPNSEAQMTRIDMSAVKMHGTAVTLRIVTKRCPEIEWNFTETDFGVLAQEAGCKNC